MTPDSTPLDLDHLLAQSAWLKRLVRSLIRDADLREDVEQDTWLAAVSFRGKIDRPREWLFHRLRGALLHRVRAEARRRRREQQAAVAPAAADAAGIVEQAEQQQRLARLVLGLDEPYRTAILLRYFQAQAPVQIAQRLGLPAGTVRSHLSRGIDLLRQRLDAEYGTSTRWHAALLPFVVEASPPSATALLIGAAMSGKGMLAALLTTSLVALCLIFAETPPEPSTALAGRPAGQALAARASAEVADVAREHDGVRRILAVGGISGAVATSQADAPSDRAPLRGLVVDTHARPLSGARVAVVDRSRPTDVLVGPLWTDAQGRFSLPPDTPTGADVLICVECPRHMPFQSALWAGGLLRIPLCEATVIEGRVLDQRAGVAIVGARVGARGVATSETAADGSYRVEVPVSQCITLWIQPRDCMPIEREIAVPEVGVYRLDVMVEAATPLAVEVVDAESGAPLAGASIGLLSAVARGLDLGTSDATGAVRIGVAEGSSRVMLAVRRDGYAVMRAVVEASAAQPAKIALLRGCTVQVQVVDEHGSPASGCELSYRVGARHDNDAVRQQRVDLIPRQPGVECGLIDLAEQSTCDGEGRVAVPDLSPLSEVAFTAELPGAEARGRVFTGRPGEAATLRLQLAKVRSASVFGTLSFNGEPGPIPFRFVVGFQHGEGRANADGTFRFETVETGSVKITAVVPGIAELTEDVRVTEGQAVRLDLALTAPLSQCSGVLSLADGTPLRRAPITVIEKGGKWRIGAITDERGRFDTWCGVKPGTPLQLRYTRGKDVYEHAALAGDEGIAFVARGLGVVRIETTDEGGVPVPNPWIVWRPADQGDWREVPPMARLARPPAMTELILPVGQVQLRIARDAHGVDGVEAVELREIPVQEHLPVGPRRVTFARR